MMAAPTGNKGVREHAFAPTTDRRRESHKVGGRQRDSRIARQFDRVVVPLLTAVSRADSALPAFDLMMIGLIIVSGYTSINAVVKAELFPARIRALGVGLPYALTVAIFGGS